jgi:hypothetical protein
VAACQASRRPNMTPLAGAFVAACFALGRHRPGLRLAVPLSVLCTLVDIHGWGGTVYGGPSPHQSWHPSVTESLVMLPPDPAGSIVPDYRVYVIGSDGHFMRAIQLDCPDDDAAIESAKQFIAGADIELWQRDRKLAKFDAKD